MPLKGRISYAGLVVKFKAMWRNFVVWEEDLTLKNNFISNQCYLDIISSCHYAVLMICYCRDAYSSQAFPIHRMGSTAARMEIAVSGDGPLFSRSYSK